jgi:Cupin superfamily protein
VPRGESFDEARMTYSDVCDALEKGTVIFNAAGAHIPKLAPICLAACDATSLPCALNMYITAAGKRISAPPHTDKQDVCIIQTQGCKAWKVFAIPDPSMKPNSDIFARGKGDDNLPLHTLKETSELLLDTTIYPGDVLFIPAGFPHTTSTVASTSVVDDDIDVDNNNNNGGDRCETSVHLTLGIDHHIWELDYLSVIRLAYRRVGRIHNPLWDNVNDAISNPFAGKINMLSLHQLEKVMEELPLGLLDAGDTSSVDSIVKKTADMLSEIDPDYEIDTNTIKETVERIRQQGIELLNIHCDMYIAAIQEGRTREAENAMTAHLGVEATTAKTLSADRIQRLSLFRVKKYYDLINDSIDRLKIWSLARDKAAMNVESTNATPLMGDAAIHKVISVGDKVEAELGGAFFPATVTRISDDGLYDVTFFDGDKEVGLGEAQIRLLSVPKPSPIVDTSKMTAKQLKRWKKEQEQNLK